MKELGHDGRYNVLVESMTELVSLLREFGADRSAEAVAEGLRLVAAGDGYGLDRVLALSGGMGSLNDLVIHPLSQHTIAEERVDEVNQRLGSLRSKVFSTARSLKRDLDRIPRDHH